jgi:hypothetical protein
VVIRVPLDDDAIVWVGGQVVRERGAGSRDAMAEDSRLDVLEGRVEELSRHWDHLFGDIRRLDQKIDTAGVALSARIDALDQKFDRRFEAVDRQFTDLGGELSKQFRWTFSTMRC